VLPPSVGSGAVVDLQNDRVFLDGDFGDLDQVAGAARGSKLFVSVGPMLLVPSAVGLEIERLARARQGYFALGVFRTQPAQNFDTLIVSELLLIGAKHDRNREHEDEPTRQNRHNSTSS